MRATSAIVFLVGLALFATPATVPVGVAMVVGGAWMGRRAFDRGEAGFVAALMLLGALGAGWVIWSYITALA